MKRCVVVCFALLSASVAAAGGDILFSIDDFEDAKRSGERWVDESAAANKLSWEIVDGRGKGSKGMKIVFPKNAKGGISLSRYLEESEQWPAEGKVVRFWVKADRVTQIRIKVNELRGGKHSTFEGFSANVDAGTEWKEIRLPLSSFAYLWGHGGGNKTLDPTRIGQLSIEQVNIAEPVTLTVDDMVVSKD